MLGCVNSRHGICARWKLSWSDLDSGALPSGTDFLYPHHQCQNYHASGEKWYHLSQVQLSSSQVPGLLGPAFLGPEKGRVSSVSTLDFILCDSYIPCGNTGIRH